MLERQRKAFRLHKPNAVKPLMSDFANNDVCQCELRASCGLEFEWNPIKGGLPLHYKSQASDLIVSIELQ